MTARASIWLVCFANSDASLGKTLAELKGKRALLEKHNILVLNRHNMVSIVLSPSLADRALFTLDEYTSDDKKGRRQ
jgi:hypothetical protein